MQGYNIIINPEKITVLKINAQENKGYEMCVQQVLLLDCISKLECKSYTYSNFILWETAIVIYILFY